MDFTKQCIQLAVITTLMTLCGLIVGFLSFVFMSTNWESL